jgi:transcriptional regulator with XRE-family HTH domain
MQSLRDIRISKGLTQAKLSEMTRLPQTLISAYETGKAFPPMKSMLILSNALDIPIEKFAEWYKARQNNTTTEAV